MTEAAHGRALGIADAHSHLDAYADDELQDVLREARQAGVDLIITVAMDAGTAARGLRIAAAEEMVFAAVGLHPWMVQDYPAGAPLDELRALAEADHVVALGEIGLDYVDNLWRGISYRDTELQRAQEEAFRGQVRLAGELGLPVIVHSRGAHDAVARILEEEEIAEVGGCIQFFEGGPGDVERFLELGMTFSVGSSVTKPDPGGWHDTVRAIPDSAILLESDAPWLPYAGKGSDRSAPSDLVLIGEAIARIRGTDLEQLSAITKANLRRALPRIA